MGRTCETCAHAEPVTDELWCWGRAGREGCAWVTCRDGEACGNYAEWGPWPEWDVERLARLMDEDCGQCEARPTCDDHSGTCAETRAAWLLGTYPRAGGVE